jgi:glycosyltransferase involved in cell wall biosynthesis
MGLRVLLTNNTLALRAGSELYLRDVALALLARGHTPIAYSPTLGEMADDLRRATIPVIDDLRHLGEPPDLIHGQHHTETMTALLHFRGVRAIYVCHGWMPWQEAPPVFPRIHRYVAVDDLCNERVVSEAGVAADRVEILPNFVDLARFAPRGPLPSRPERALIFGFNASDDTYAPIVREACTRAGIGDVDVVGYGNRNPTATPEHLLPNYDLVFAKGRSALEALAVGCAVVLCDVRGVGPMVAAADVDRLRAANFGIRTLTGPMDVGTVLQQIERWDADDAAAASARIRRIADREHAIDRLLALYDEVRTAPPRAGEGDAAAESAAAAIYLRDAAQLVKRHLAELGERARLAERERERIRGIGAQTSARLSAVIAALLRIKRTGPKMEQATQRMTLALERMSEDYAAIRREYEALRQSPFVRLRDRLLASRILGAPSRLAIRLAKGRLYS